MVRLCPFGGRLNQDIQELKTKAAQLHAQEKLDAASDLYREVLAFSPHDPDALHMLGIIAQQQGKSELALQWFDAALTAKPDYLQARYNRSVILRALQRNAEALESVRKALEAAPDFAAAWDMAGQILKDDGNFAEAAKCHAHATSLQPKNAHFLGNYGLLLFAQGDLSAAYQMAREAEALDSSYPPMLLGNILRAWGHPEKAAACFAKVRSLIPQLADAFASEAMAKMQMGDMEEGLTLWIKRPHLSSTKSKLPPWDGQDVSSLMLYEDQGLGDALQFLRYVPLLKRRAKHLILRLREPLLDLCRMNFPDIDVLSENDPEPEADARCRLSSLPFFFAARLDTISPAPYLQAPIDTAWRMRLGAMQKPRIGLVWAGNAKFKNDAARSIDFRTLDPLLSFGLPHFVSLQKERPANALPQEIFDAAPYLNNFADTAALIAELDLVISVDTATAHLAGALGKPVFILLPFNSDWRWLIEREDSPWYGSARLFRQKRLGDWDDTLMRVSIEVGKFICGDANALRAAPWKGPPFRQNPNALPL